MNEDLSVSNDLRKNRLSKKIEIATAAQALRIRRDYLIALEDGNLKVLPERVYTLGFVRAYARYLGLDIDTTLQRFKSEVLGDPKSPVYHLPKPINENTKPHNWLILLSAGLGLLILGIWFFFFNTPPMASLRPSIPSQVKEELKSLAVEAPSPSIASQEDITENKAEPFIGSLKQVEPHSADLAPPPVKQNIGVPGPSTPSSFEKEAAGPPLEESSPLSQARVSEAGLNKKAFTSFPYIKILEPSWIEIKDTEGRLIEKRLFQAGERLSPYPFEVELVIGNAGGVELVSQGRSTLLGKQGEVIRGIRLAALKGP